MSLLIAILTFVLIFVVTVIAVWNTFRIWYKQNIEIFTEKNIFLEDVTLV